LTNQGSETKIVFRVGEMQPTVRWVYGRGDIRMADTQKEKNLKSIDDFRMFDDTFMSAVFDGKIEETQFLI